MADVLDAIVEHRRADFARLGPSFGCAVPAHRKRALVPFLEGSGVILEIKRASPSKGDIAPDLEPVSLAARYRAAGAKNVSVLTEGPHFKGSLDDLVAVGSAHPDLSLLRKDFILYEEEVDVSYRAGADAVLLIARILETPLLLKLAAAIRARGMTPLVEVRETGDLAKLEAALRSGPVVAGVNSRDLATFAIDPLIPAVMRSRLPCKSVFESGTSTAGAARFARRLGFEGILIGEAAAKDPEGASVLVEAFNSARPDWTGQFWRDIGRRAAERSRPLVKVCGITRPSDGLLAAELGADLLGFVFAESPRKTNRQTVVETSRLLSSSESLRRRPLLVAVVTGCDQEADPALAEALGLAREGIVDAIQYHGGAGLLGLERVDEGGGPFGVGRYAAVRLGEASDLELLASLRTHGEPRALVDARVPGIPGGTGRQVPADLVEKARGLGGLWLAGGLTPSNVASLAESFEPELVDVSSGVESSPGVKDEALLREFFMEVAR